MNTEHHRTLLSDYPLGSLTVVDPRHCRLVYAVDVSLRSRCDAQASPDRGFYYHPLGVRLVNPSQPAVHTSGFPNWVSLAIAGPLPSMCAVSTLVSTLTKLPFLWLLGKSVPCSTMIVARTRSVLSLILSTFRSLSLMLAMNHPNLPRNSAVQTQRKYGVHLYWILKRGM